MIRDGIKLQGNELEGLPSLIQALKQREFWKIFNIYSISQTVTHLTSN